MIKKRLLAGITVNVLILGTVSFLTDVGSEMIFALLPLYMTTVLGIEMAFVGLIEGAAESATSILKAFSGWFSDKIGRRKPLVAVGYGASTLSKPFFAVVTSPLQVLLIRVLDRVGKGIRTSPRDALIADSIKPEGRGRAYGLHRSLDTTGAVLGPLLAFILLPMIWYTGVFIASIIPGALAVILLVALVKEERHPVESHGSRYFLRELRTFDIEFKLFLVVVVIFALSNFSYAFFLLRARDTGVHENIIPLIYLLYNAVYATSAFPLGSLADKVGKKTMLFLGYLIFGCTCLGFAFASSPYHSVFLFVLYGLFQAFTDAVQRAFVPDFVSVESRGTAFGIFHTSIGLAALPASLLAGALWQLFGSSIPFLVGAAISISSAVLLSLIVRPKQPLQLCNGL